jgi:hypothetical protein
MRLLIFLVVLAAAVALSVGLYYLSGGRMLFFGLPLILVGPLAFRRRRG